MYDNTTPNHRPKYGRYLFHCCECMSFWQIQNEIEISRKYWQGQTVIQAIRHWSLFVQLTRSDMASTAPNAQHEPQLPWSRISRMVGQFGHLTRESNSSGKSSLGLPNSLAGCWNRFESGCTPIKPRKNDSGIDEWKFGPACNKKQIQLKKIPSCAFHTKSKIGHTRHVVAFLLVSSINCWDNGLLASSSSSDNAKVINENTNKILE